MFQSLVITLREGVEAALIVGIVSGYLSKTGRASLNRIVYWALFAAVGASLALGFILHTLQLTELGDAYEGWLMLTGAVLVASMTVWMWRTGKRLKQEIETKLSSLAGEPRAPGRWAAWGLFVFVFLMVFREGTETVLFLAAVSLRTTALMNFIGGVIGLALAVGLGVAFFKGSLKVNLRKFFAVTTLVLLVVAVQLFVSGVHDATVRAVNYARSLHALETRAVYFALDQGRIGKLVDAWFDRRPGIDLDIVDAPFRDLSGPMLQEVRKHTARPNTIVSLVIPELIPRRKIHYLLHRQTALFVKRLFLFEPNVVLTSVPYHLA